MSIEYSLGQNAQRFGVSAVASALKQAGYDIAFVESYMDIDPGPYARPLAIFQNHKEALVFEKHGVTFVFSPDDYKDGRQQFSLVQLLKEKAE